MTPWLARASLVGVGILLLASALAPVRPSPTAGPSINRTAMEHGTLFKSVIDRVRRGQSYYDAMGEELPSRHYPTSSVFNWRTPAIFFLMAGIGLTASWWLLVLLSAALMVLAIRHFELQRDAVTMVSGVVAVLGALLVTLAPAMLIEADAWGGVFIGLSVLAYSRFSWRWGALLGLTALFVRELAAPYCAVAALLALRDRRRGELWMWLAGGVALAVFYGVHVSQVLPRQGADPAPVQYSWFRWGGLPFLLETINQNNAILLNRPRVLTAAFVALVGLALFASQVPAHARWSAIAYALVFLAIGQPFNDYWGLVTAPTLAFCAAFGPLGLTTLWRLARFRASPASSDG